MTTVRTFALALALLCLAPGALVAQGEQGAESSQDTVYHLVLSDGSEFHGRIESRTADRVVFVTLSGVRMELQPGQIARLEPSTGRVVGGQVWPRDPNATRLFFGPTGRSLPSGEGYVGLFELFFSFGAVGVGDHLVLAGGTPVIPELFGQVLYLAPKLRLLSTGNADLAVGALAFFLRDELDEGSAGIVYGVGTLGDEDSALTVGAGWGFALGEEATLSNDPVFLLGGETRTSRRVKAITENYFIYSNSEAVALLSGGVRFLGDRFSADVGAGASYFDTSFECCLPVLSASFTF